MSRDDLPAPFTPNKDIREAALTGHRLTFGESLGGNAPGDYSRLVVKPDNHIVHVIGCQLNIGIRRLLQAFEVLLLVSNSAPGISKNKFLSLDAIKKGIVAINVRLADVPLQLHQRLLGA